MEELDLDWYVEIDNFEEEIEDESIISLTIPCVSKKTIHFFKVLPNKKYKVLR